MTRNQIAYQQLQEEKRANQAKEAELHRANVVKERENERSNRASEIITYTRDQNKHAVDAFNAATQRGTAYVNAIGTGTKIGQSIASLI